MTEGNYRRHFSLILFRRLWTITYKEMSQFKNPLAEIVYTKYSPGPEKMSINEETVSKLWTKIGCIRNRPKKA